MPIVREVAELPQEEVRELLGVHELLASPRLFRIGSSCGHDLIAPYPPPEIGAEVLCHDCVRLARLERQKKTTGSPAVMDRRRIGQAPQLFGVVRTERDEPSDNGKRPDLELYTGDSPKAQRRDGDPRVPKYALTFHLADGRRLRINFGAEGMAEIAEIIQRYLLERSFSE